MNTQTTPKGNISYTAHVDLAKSGYFAEDITLINNIKNGDFASLDKFYAMHRREFIKWAYKYFRLTADQALDIYHDTFIILYENVKKGKLQHLNSRLKTYMFSISKNIILNQYARDKKFSQGLESVSEQSAFEDGSADELYLLQEALVKCLNNLSTPSQTLIKAYYYDKLSMSAIAENLGYKNAGVAKSLKLRGVKALKKALQATIKDN